MTTDIQENILGAAGDPSVDIENPEVKTQVNSLLGRALETSFITPYMGIERISNVLSRYHIPVPKSSFLEGDHGYKVFDVVQFGHKFGMNDQGEVVQKDECSCSLYFEYQLNDDGEFDIFAEIVSQEELDEILNDVEAEENEERLDEAASQKASKALARILRKEKIKKTVRILNRNLRKETAKKAPAPAEEPKRKVTSKKKLTSKTLPLPEKPKAKKEEPKKVEPKKKEPKKVEVAKKAVKRIRDMKKTEPPKKAAAPAKPSKSILFKREQKAPAAEKPKVAQKVMAHHPIAPKVPEKPRNAFEIAWDKSAAGPSHTHPRNMKDLADVAYAEQQKDLRKASTKADYDKLNNEYSRRMSMIRSLGHNYTETAPYDHIKKHIEDGILDPDHVILANMHHATKRDHAIGKITKSVHDSRLKTINKLSKIVHGTTEVPAIPGINPDSDSKHKSIRKFHQVLGKFTKKAPVKVFTEQTMEKALEIMNKKVL